MLLEVICDDLTALQEISTSVTTIDTVTQQNAAMVEETTAATHSLAGEVTTLNDQLSKFRVGGNGDADVAQGSTETSPDTGNVALAMTG